MRKSDLAAAIAQKADLTKEEAQRVLETILDQIVSAVGRKDTVNLVGFGSFEPRHRGARAGKNPQTGESIIIGASNTVAFKPGKNLREAILPLTASALSQAVKRPEPRTSVSSRKGFASEQRV